MLETADIASLQISLNLDLKGISDFFRHMVSARSNRYETEPQLLLLWVKDIYWGTCILGSQSKASCKIENKNILKYYIFFQIDLAEFDKTPNDTGFYFFVTDDQYHYKLYSHQLLML